MKTPNRKLLAAELAVMNILCARRVSFQRNLPVDELRRDAPDYGLSDAEFDAGLVDLTRRGLIQRTADWVTLTDAGKAWWNAFPAWLEYRLLRPTAKASSPVAH